MYICLCNALRDKEITRAIEGGASCAEEVYGCFDCKPVCGQCVPEIQDQLELDRKNSAIANH